MDIWKSYLELRGEELYKSRSSQLEMKLLQLRKERLKKIQACMGFEPLTSAIPVQCSFQMSYQANWEQIVELVHYKPVKGWWWSYEYKKIIQWTAQWIRINYYMIESRPLQFLIQLLLFFSGFLLATVKLSFRTVEIQYCFFF